MNHIFQKDEFKARMTEELYLQQARSGVALSTIFKVILQSFYLKWVSEPSSHQASSLNVLMGWLEVLTELFFLHTHIQKMKLGSAKETTESSESSSTEAREVVELIQLIQQQLDHERGQM
eukprot:CAMPEP_0168619238 /NCGR_PEP_ID=MMETSP0449_2-20121227/6494_1 /TAXON_ID=1082188 /ORGANISM="Strombidium rassoulzadegani, Strain ras09" /LENGTH=119 /DNA_ID=CAMNT_0008660157 /DNA_START=479 /DNA_END=835 /DNA_ORIENTATION=-